jgi:uncharacterized protein (PEP-CTERM system associated)
VGAEHEFNPKLNVKGKVGIQYTTYDSGSGGGNSVGPFADVNGNYSYAPGSVAQVGVTHQRSATDVAGAPGSPVKDTEATTLYGSVTHQMSPNVFLNLLASYQHTVFNGGGAAIDNTAEDFINLSLNFEYRFNQNWSAEAGYIYDKLTSDNLSARDFDRNRIFLGVRATY